MSIRGRESKIERGSFDSPNFDGFTLSRVFKVVLVYQSENDKNIHLETHLSCRSKFRIALSIELKVSLFEPNGVLSLLSMQNDAVSHNAQNIRCLYVAAKLPLVSRPDHQTPRSSIS